MAHLHGTVTPIHLIIHELNAVLHLLWREEFRLANHGWKSQKKDLFYTLYTLNLALMCIKVQHLSTLTNISSRKSYLSEIYNNSRSTALLEAEAPIPLFWIWYTGWVGRCPSFSILEGPGPEGWAATSGGVPGFIPSSLAFISMMGFSGAGAPPTCALCGGFALKRIQYQQNSWKVK